MAQDPLLTGNLNLVRSAWRVYTYKIDIGPGYDRRRKVVSSLNGKKRCSVRDYNATESIRVIAPTARAMTR